MRDSNPRFERVLTAVVLLSAMYPFLDLCRAAWAFTTDDAFISLRYAHFWAMGEGVRFNAEGPPVEGYSNFGFVLLSSVLLRLGIDPLLVLKALGVAACPLTAMVLYRIARGRVSRLFATLPGVVYLAFPGTAWWAVSGLETTLYTLSVVVALWLFLRSSRRPAFAVLAGAVIALAGWLRPDGPLIGLVLSIVLVGQCVCGKFGRGRSSAATPLRTLLRLAVGFLPLYAPYLLWRIVYFGHLLPNSVTCKLTYGGSPWTVILEYVPVLIVSLAVLGWAGRRLLSTTHLACLLFNAMTIVLLYGVDTTISYGLRHFFAAFVLLLIPVAAGAQRLSVLRGGPESSRGWVAMVVLHAIVWGSISVCNVEGRLQSFAQDYAERSAVRAEVAGWLREQLPEGATYVLGDVGVCGYLTPNLQLIDAYCLNNGALGHAAEGTYTEVLTQQVLEQRPAAMVLTSRSPTVLKSRSARFARVLEDPRVWVHYELAAVFGDDEGGFNYWVYRRRSNPAGDPARR